MSFHNSISSKKYLKKPLVMFGFMLYPLYALPWIIKYMLKNDRFGYILFSLLMAYLAYTMIPYDTMDIIRHYETFERISGLKVSEVFGYGSIFYYALNLYMWIVHYIGLPKEFVPFSLIFFQYILYFASLRKILTLNQEKNESIPFWLIALGVFFVTNEIRFIGTASGLRNGLAFSVFIYAVIGYVFEGKRIRFIWLSLLAMIIHMSILPLFLLMEISSFFRLKSIGRILFIASLIVLVTDSSQKIFYTIVGLLEPFLKSVGLYFHAYMDPSGVWGGGYYADKNIKTILLESVIKPFPFYLAGLYLLIVKDFKNSFMQNYFYYLYIFIALVSVSKTMLDRYSYFFVLLFMLVLLSEIQKVKLSKFKKFFITALISGMLMMDFGGIIKYRDIIISWKKILFVPAPMMMLQEVSPDDYLHRESL